MSLLSTSPSLHGRLMHQLLTLFPSRISPPDSLMVEKILWEGEFTLRRDL
jgi:hypothetical protein